MKFSTVKRIAGAGAISGAMGLAALGFGAGTAGADESDIPFMPADTENWQSYIPMVQSLGDIVSTTDFENLGSGGNLGTLENLAAIGGVGDLGSLGSLDQGQIENLLAIMG